MHVGNIPKYARKDQKNYFNNELIEIAKKNNYFVPKDHFFMPVIPDYLENDNAKYFKSRNWSPNEYQLKLAREAFTLMFEGSFTTSKVLTLDEAIQIAEKTTSPGYIYKKYGFKDKGSVFTDFYDELKEKIKAIEEGKNVSSIFELAPKVEIRPLEKLISDDESKRKQRTFMVADCLAYLVGLMLYYDQNQKEYEKCYDFDTWNGVGVSIFQGGWDSLAKGLLKHSKWFLLCDESAMEACCSPYILDLIYDVRNIHLTEEKNINLGKWFKNLVMYGYVIDLLGRIFKKLGINPSGQPNTLMDNNMALTFKIMYHIARLCSSSAELLHLCKKLGIKLVGDDSVLPLVKYKGINVFKDIEKSSLDIGFSTTFETEHPVTISELKFLNFSFIYDIYAQQFTFEPNYDKLFASLFFYKKKNSWRLTLAKLFAMKMLCTADIDKYIQICCYIEHIKNNHMLDMINEKHLDKEISMHSLLAQEKTKSQIRDLLFNLE